MDVIVIINNYFGVVSRVFEQVVIYEFYILFCVQRIFFLWLLFFGIFFVVITLIIFGSVKVFEVLIDLGGKIGKYTLKLQG